MNNINEFDILTKYDWYFSEEYFRLATKNNFKYALKLRGGRFLLVTSGDSVDSKAYLVDDKFTFTFHEFTSNVNDIINLCRKLTYEYKEEIFKSFLSSEPLSKDLEKFLS